MCLFLWHFENGPAPTRSYSLPNSVPGKSRHISLNAILELFSTTARFALGFSLTKALGQLTWVWFRKRNRQLADFSVFDQVAKSSPVRSLKLVMMLKARLVRLRSIVLCVYADSVLFIDISQLLALSSL